MRASRRLSIKSLEGSGGWGLKRQFCTILWYVGNKIVGGGWRKQVTTFSLKTCTLLGKYVKEDEKELSPKLLRGESAQGPQKSQWARREANATGICEAESWRVLAPWKESSRDLQRAPWLSTVLNMHKMKLPEASFHKSMLHKSSKEKMA